MRMVPPLILATMLVSATGATCRAVAQASRDPAVERLRAALAAGRRVVIMGITFAPRSDELLPSSLPHIRHLAKAINATSGTFVLVAHVQLPSDSVAAQALAEWRATAVKAQLFAEGVPAARILAVGYGAVNARTAGAVGPEPGNRIEVVRPQ